MKRKSFKEFLNDSYKMSVEQLAEKTASEQGGIQAAYMDATADWINGESAKTTADVLEIAKAVSDLNEATTKANVMLQKALQDQGLAIQKMLDGYAKDPAVLSEAIKKLDSGLEIFNKSVEEGNKGKEIVLTNMTKAELHALVNKTTVVAGSVINNTDAYRVNDIGQLATRSLQFYDLFPKVPVGANSNGVVKYTDWDQATTVRAAAMVAEGGTFPVSTAVWQEFAQSIKKIGDSIPVSYESTKDRARFVAELQAFISTNVDLKIDQQLYDGDDIGQNLNGVYTTAVTFVPVASAIPSANIFDLIRKVRTDISSNKQKKYMANIVALNPADIDRMLLTKDANFNYVRPDFFKMGDGTNVYIVSGALVIESNAVTANTMLEGDSRYAKIYEEGGYEIAMGYATGDFENDLITMKARKRLLMLVRNVDKDAWRKVTDIDAALVVLAT